jgi:hypothetical protein
MRGRFYRGRTWPWVGDSYVLITWVEPHDASERAIIDWFLLSDADDEFVGYRYRVKLGEAYPGGTTDIDFWIGVVEGEVRNHLQVKVDGEALHQERPLEPPSVTLKEIDALEVLALRLRGRGEAGLEAAGEVARDLDTRSFVRAVLAVHPLKPERIPRRENP